MPPIIDITWLCLSTTTSSASAQGLPRPPRILLAVVVPPGPFPAGTGGRPPTHWMSPQRLRRHLSGEANACNYNTPKAHNVNPKLRHNKLPLILSARTSWVGGLSLQHNRPPHRDKMHAPPTALPQSSHVSTFCPLQGFTHRCDRMRHLEVLRSINGLTVSRPRCLLLHVSSPRQIYG